MLENESGLDALVDSNEVKEVDAIEPEASKAEIPEPENKANGEEVPKKKPNGHARQVIKLKERLAATERELAEHRARIDPKQPDSLESQLDNLLTKRQTAEKEAEIESAWESKIEALDEKKFEEYQNLIEDYKDVDLRTQLIKSAKKSDIGPEILLYLDKNPEIFDKLNHKDISDLSIKRGIEALEKQLMNNQKPAVRGSKSPAPIVPLKGSSPTSVDDKDLDTDAYITKHHSNLIRKR